MTARDWNAATYDRIADPMSRWGSSVVDRLGLRGDETVLDAGCGSGRVTEYLLGRLPHGRVIALDASAAMIEQARRRLAWAGNRVQFVQADLRGPLPLVEPVDAILSTATFHWIADHDRLFRTLAAVLRSGGRLAAQSGGTGNVANVLRIAAEVGGPIDFRWCFPAPEEEAARLEAAGFVEVETWLQPEPTRLEPGEPVETYLATIPLREHVARYADPDEAAAFVHVVASRMDEPVIDYVRINIVSRLG